MIEEIGTTEQGDLVVNLGPQHPSTHGVLHLVITLSGETIKKVEPHLGYIHRSIEKMCESLSYRQFIYVTSRMDYLSSHINNHGCALCVEKGMQIEVPPRAKTIRVLMDAPRTPIAVTGDDPSEGAATAPVTVVPVLRTRTRRREPSDPLRLLRVTCPGEQDAAERLCAMACPEAYENVSSGLATGRAAPSLYPRRSLLR